MRLKKIVVAVTLITFVGSDFTFGIAPALGQLSSTGDGRLPMPSPSGDGNFGWGLTGPSTSVPYLVLPQQPLQQPQLQPRYQYVPPPRTVAPATANLCQPGGGVQIASLPRTRPFETLPGAPAPSNSTAAQVAATQGTLPQVSQLSTETRKLGPEATRPELEELSRIEAAFNLDPVRQIVVPLGTMQFYVEQSANLHHPRLHEPSLQQPPPGQQQPFAQLAALQPQPAAQPQPGAQQPTPQSQLLQQQQMLPPMLGPFGAPLRQYGYAMFASNVSTFAPVDDIPVGPDYVLGPGDDVTINVWGTVDSTLVRTVDRNGRIVLPKVGDLRIWGLSFAQADRLIRDELARYFRGFQTSVTMGRLRTVNVYVVGEVCQPGVYTLSSLSTVTNALFSSGGPTKLGSLREVRLIRGGYQVAKLDLYDFLQRGDRTRDYRLESGDTIFVPPIGDVVAVAGEVKRPAIYEIRSDTRLADVVSLAGGVTPTSYLKRVQVVRALPSSERITVDVDLTGYYLKGDEAGNPPVNGGDLVLIHRSDPRIYNTVKVEGAVKYPGAYELKPMMRISQLLPVEKLLPEAYPERVEIARRRPDLSVEILSVNLKKAWSGDAAEDVLLKPLDEISVRTELRPTQTVTLTGQVVRPGVYTIATGEQLSSVLERAGGFTDRAFLKGSVFTRASLRKIEQEQLDTFLKTQEQRMLAVASAVTLGGGSEEVAAQRQALETRRELLKTLASKIAVGRMVVRLETPAKLKGSDNDVVLADGDTLEVPEPPQSVLVVGAVRNSTSVQYRPGVNADYYINRVGGYAKEADKKEVHLLKADGSAASSFTNIRDVEPGDSIIVPPKAEEKTRWMPTFSAVAQILGSTLLGLAALAVLF